MTEARPLYADATAENFHVTAFTVSRPVRYAEVYKALAKAIRSFVRDELLKLPDKITERIVKLAMAGTCPVLGGEVLKSTSGDGDGGVIFDFGDPSATGERLQGLIEGVYDELVTHHRADSSHIFAETSISRRKASGSVAWSKNLASEEDGDTERKERRETMRKEREEMAEREACEGSEKVEGLLCRILYNRSVSSATGIQRRTAHIIQTIRSIGFG